MAQTHGPILPWGLVKQNLSMNESNTEHFIKIKPKIKVAKIGRQIIRVSCI